MVEAQRADLAKQQAKLAEQTDSLQQQSRQAQWPWLKGRLPDLAYTLFLPVSTQAAKFHPFPAHLLSMVHC